jgi:hypothetical protein
MFKEILYFIKDIYKGLKNCIYFFNVIWSFRDYDYIYQLKIFKKSLIPLRDRLINGSEVEISRFKKIEKINRVLEILDNIIYDRYTTLAELQLGYQYQYNSIFNRPNKKNSKILKKSNYIEKMEWIELWKIIKGQDYSKFNDTPEHLQNDNDEIYNHWQNQFDGSGMNGWWD